MEELFIETKDGKIPINPEVTQKFKLDKGTRSPFTRQRIVGKNGEFPDQPPKNDSEQDGATENPDMNKADAENVQFSTSEIIDLAHGEDSSEH